MDATLQEKIMQEVEKAGISEAMAWHLVMAREISDRRIVPLSAERFDQNQPRDERGRWSASGFSGIADSLYKGQGKVDWEADYIASLPVKGYFGTSSAFQINQNLRTGQKLSERQQYAYDAVEKAFETSGVNLPKSAKLYRAVSGEFASTLSSMEPGQTFTDAGFSSTSADKKYVARFGRTVMEIREKPGSSMKVLLHKGEKEVLLPRGTRFTVTGKRKDGDTTIVTMDAEK